MTEIICATITAFAGLLVVLLSKRIAQSDAMDEQRSELRQEESWLSLKMQNATLNLTRENSVGILSGNNFEAIEDALEKANAVSEEYQSFLQKVTAREVGK